MKSYRITNRTSGWICGGAKVECQPPANLLMVLSIERPKCPACGSPMRPLDCLGVAAVAAMEDLLRKEVGR